MTMTGDELVEQLAKDVKALREITDRWGPSQRRAVLSGMLDRMPQGSKAAEHGVEGLARVLGLAIEAAIESGSHLREAHGRADYLIGGYRLQRMVVTR